VAYDGFGVGMLAVGVGIVGTLVEQVSPPAVTVVAGKAFRQIAAQRIDSDLQHQARPGRQLIGR
jgi:hypothetical protein